MVDASAQPVACNFRSFESMDYESRDLTDSILLTNVGEQDEDGFYATLHPEKAIYLHCRNLDIDIRNIDIRNIHLVIEGYREGAPIPYYTVTPVISDAGNQNSYTLWLQIISLVCFLMKKPESAHAAALVMMRTSLLKPRRLWQLELF